MSTPLLGTGLDGLVGSRFVELFGEDFTVTNLSLTTGVDITDQAAVEREVAASSAAVMVHAAAFTDVGAAWQQQGDETGPAYRVNVLGTRNIARAAAAAGKYLIHLSTDYVFDGQQSTPYTEEDEPHPIEWYGETKWRAEQEVTAAGGKAIILRLAFPYRAHFAAKQDILAKTLAGLRATSLYPQFSDTLITPTFIDDLAAVILYCLQHRPTGCWHAVGCSSLSNYDFARTVARVFGLDPESVKKGSLTEYLAANPGRPYHRYLALANDRLQAATGLQMTTLAEGLTRIHQQLNSQS